MPKPKNAKTGQSEIKEIDLDDLLGGCAETPETKKKQKRTPFTPLATQQKSKVPKASQQDSEAST